MNKSNMCGVNVHHIKTWTKYFKDAKSGIKPFEVRKNDRDYQVGDTLILEEFDPVKQVKTGAWAPKRVTYKLDDAHFVKEGYVILGTVDIKV
ncbi:DUF3850 domain-containing protein [Clostridium thailandense]|uniref:DUF3850 domain-containing protein n=1 Tax=Clostridium thailandense TaxID=2794346 RepID=UPI003988EB10